MTTKTKTLSLKNLIKNGDFKYVNDDITPENFPPEEIRSEDYKLFHFGRYITSEDAIKEMEKEGFSPANIYELLSWKDWNGSDVVVGLGSSVTLHGGRCVPYLGDWDGRKLRLSWWSGEWDVHYRFLAVRTGSLKTENSDTKALGSSDTLQKAIEECKKAGYKVIKEF